MSALIESTAEHTTLGDLKDLYAFDIGAGQVAPVTVTSLTDSIATVSPGALYIVRPPTRIDEDLIAAAADRGAYAVLLPTSYKGAIDQADADIPVVFGDITPLQTARLAARMAGRPADDLAMFVVCGRDATLAARALADLLHILGNPVGLISHNHTYYLERLAAPSYPLDGMQVETILAGALEDGATSVVIDATPATIADDALGGVSVDVCGLMDYGSDGLDPNLDVHANMAATLQRCAPTITDSTLVATRTVDSDEIAAQNVHEGDPYTVPQLSMGIAMVMQAGIRKGSIRNALRIAREMRDLR